jgi:hypothetical protein
MCACMWWLMFCRPNAHNCCLCVSKRCTRSPLLQSADWTVLDVQCTMNEFITQPWVFHRPCVPCASLL